MIRGTKFCEKCMPYYKSWGNSLKSVDETLQKVKNPYGFPKIRRKTKSAFYLGNFAEIIDISLNL